MKKLIRWKAWKDTVEDIQLMISSDRKKEIGVKK